MKFLLPTFYRLSVFLLLFAFLPSLSLSQVNTESLRTEQDDDGFSFTTNFSMGLSDGNVRVFNMRGNVRLDYHNNKNHAFTIAQYARGVQNENLFRNSGFLALRNTYNFRPAIGWEVFMQQQFDDFLRLRDRKLAGTGLRFRLVNYDPEESDKALRLFLGTGGMYEYEDINAAVPEKNHLLRSTNYVSLLWIISDRINLNVVSYFQIAASNPADYRNLLDSVLEIRLSRTTSFTFMTNYRYDNNPPAEVKPFDIEIQNGLRLAF